VQFGPEICSDFINYYINSPFCRATQLVPNIIQQNGQANFNGTKLKAILCPLPPISKQYIIVNKLGILNSKCDSLDYSIKQSQDQNEMLLQQVLKEALQPKEEPEKN